MREPLSRTAVRRAIYALSAVAIAEIVGTIGFHVIEGAGWIDSFYFESMLATGQGPPFPLTTDTGKVFASIMGFVSVGSVLSAVFFAVGPILIRLWHEGVEVAEREGRRFEQEAAREVRRIEQEFSGPGRAKERPPSGPAD